MHHEIAFHHLQGLFAQVVVQGSKLSSRGFNVDREPMPPPVRRGDRDRRAMDGWNNGRSFRNVRFRGSLFMRCGSHPTWDRRVGVGSRIDPSIFPHPSWCSHPPIVEERVGLVSIVGSRWRIFPGDPYRHVCGWTTLASVARGSWCGVVSPVGSLRIDLLLHHAPWTVIAKERGWKKHPCSRCATTSWEDARLQGVVCTPILESAVEPFPSPSPSPQQIEREGPLLLLRRYFFFTRRGWRRRVPFEPRGRRGSPKGRQRHT